jgi:rhodanese-related sulfurtransferase
MERHPGIERRRITLQEAKTKIDRGEALVLDVTSSLIWPAVRQRVAGAVRLAPEELLAHQDRAPEILARVGGLSQRRDVIVYCT